MNAGNTQTAQLPVNPDRKNHRARPKLIVFLVCLAISILMWLFIELMKDYSDEVKYNITFTNMPKDLILTNSGDSLLHIGLRAQGFELLEARYTLKNRQLTIDLSALKIRQTADGYTAYLPSAQVIEQLKTQIRFKNEIAYIKPDTLFFSFSEIFKKQVPVIPDIDFSIGSQYDITDSLTFRPQMVTVSSIKNIIDTIRFVKTQRINLDEIDSVVKMHVPLFKGHNANLIRYSTDSVSISLKVEEVTEEGYTVPIETNPKGENIKIFPDKAEIVCRVPLSEFPYINRNDFAAEVVFDRNATSQKTLKIKVAKSPKNIRVLKTIPAEVEYIIIDK
jgi:hypothetical protein